MPKKEEKCLSVCATCPWLKKNQGKKHQAGWYTPANLKRLWNGLRSGEAPGMVCHSSDSESPEYGGTAKIKEGVKRECAGAIVLIITHVNQLVERTYAAYRKLHKFPMSKGGMTYWVERHIFGKIPPVEDRSKDIGLPWDKE